jgi:hypothetical protein
MPALAVYTRGDGWYIPYAVNGDEGVMAGQPSKRRHARIETDATLDYLGTDMMLDHRIENLSASGLSLVSSTREPVGTRVQLTINFPDFQESITVGARVARHIESPRKAMGLEFTDLTADDRVALDRYLAERNARLAK